MLLMYTINCILERIRMIIYFTLILFNYIYFIKIYIICIAIAINILKLQKNLLLISSDRYSNNAPHHSQFIIEQQSIINMKNKVVDNLFNRHKHRLQSFVTK